MAQFDSPGVALAGWLHLLAFDPFVGALIVRAARVSDVPFALVLPCLPLAFLFGLAGLAFYDALRAALHPRLRVT